MSLRLAAVACALSLAALLVAGPVLGSVPPRTALQGFTCTRGLDPPDRGVAVTAVMRPLAGTAHMAIRFQLLASRTTTGAGRPVRAGDLGRWITPRNSTLGQLPDDVWNLQKSVIQLAAPATYRFRVQFRWEDQRGHVLGTQVRYTRRCQQRELRPDLLVRSITVSPISGQPNQDLYTALIANNGNSAAGPFEVLFAPGDGSATTTHNVASLGAHASRQEVFTGPVCTSSTAPTITVDSAHQVDDLKRSNNAMQATCPASGGG
jgi:CARDB